MKKGKVKTLGIIGLLFLATCVVMAYGQKAESKNPTGPTEASTKAGIMTMTGALAQNKIHVGGDGQVAFSLTLRADKMPGEESSPAGPVDMVVVLDRSGSMQGEKLRDAKAAIIRLMDMMADGDRLALVSYSDDVSLDLDLTPLNEPIRTRVENMVHRIQASGSTNLGGGLSQGIDMLSTADRGNRQGKVLLISDGLANRGITDPEALGRVASRAVNKEFAISTVGVGTDFNEFLMTAIADRGAGVYHFLDNPAAFAEVFAKELTRTRLVAASSMEIRVPLTDGVILTDAAGFPIERQGNLAVFRPGELMSGQTRKIFLTFNVPVGEENTFKIGPITANYLHEGTTESVTLSGPFSVACVKDRQEAVASIDAKEWEEKVIRDDFSRLREDVAKDIKAGNKDEALSKIEHYRTKQQAINEVLGSDRVQENLDQDVSNLSDTVTQSFEGAPSVVEQKKKENAKAIQSKGYGIRRGY